MFKSLQINFTHLFLLIFSGAIDIFWCWRPWKIKNQKGNLRKENDNAATLDVFKPRSRALPSASPLNPRRAFATISHRTTENTHAVSPHLHFRGTSRKDCSCTDFFLSEVENYVAFPGTGKLIEVMAVFSTAAEFTRREPILT